VIEATQDSGIAQNSNIMLWIRGFEIKGERDLTKFEQE